MQMNVTSWRECARRAPSLRTISIADWHPSAPTKEFVHERNISPWNVMNFLALFRSQERFQFGSPNVRAILFSILKRIQINERIGKSVLEKTTRRSPSSFSFLSNDSRTKRSIIRANRRKLEWNEGTIGAICNNEPSSIGRVVQG